jgi:oligopeptide/dipeptide ABC transporter ATP-binding protein
MTTPPAAAVTAVSAVIASEAKQSPACMSASSPAGNVGIRPTTHRSATDAAPILRVENLSVHFPVRHGVFGTRIVKALDDVSFDVPRGITLGIAGESGCGKSTLGFAVTMLQKLTAGRVIFDGTDLGQLGRRAVRQMRRRMQIVFQDSAASLNPRTQIGAILGQALDIHGLCPGRQRTPRIRALLDMVGLAANFADRFPHQLSGGQAQRVAIARALAVGAELIVYDEPVSALDVSIQAQIVNLLQNLQRELALTYLFISHDLSIVRHISDIVAVMYLGRIVEFAPKTSLYAHPSHPYSQALLSAVPVPDPALERARQRIILKGDLPDPTNPPSGCGFRTRCPIAIAACAELAPPPFPVADDHWARCIRVGEPATVSAPGLSP